MSLSNSIGNGIGMKRRYTPAAPPPEERSQVEPMLPVKVRDPFLKRVMQAMKNLFPRVKKIFIGNTFFGSLSRGFK